MRAMTLPIFTEGSPRVLGIVLAASCHMGVCDIRHDFDRAQFWYPQQVWDDLYSKPWTVELAGERWFQNLSRWDPTIKRGATK